MGEPNNVGIGENCVEANTDMAWHDDLCTLKKKAICEATPTNAAEPEAIWSNPCYPDEDAILINKKCYTVIDQQMSQSDAKTACEALNKRLFEPTFNAENSAVSSAIDNTFWLGFSDEANEGQ